MSRLHRARRRARSAAYLGGIVVPPLLPTIALVITPPAQVEGGSGTTAYLATATLTRNGSTAAVPFTWSVAGAGPSPADAADFGGAFQSGSGAFAPGETVKTFQVLVAGDQTVELDESFLVTLVATGVGTATANGTILNDDVPAAGAVYRVVGLIGQSNMAGRPVIVAGTDTDQANVKQWPNISSDTATYRALRDSINPLYHPENHAVGGPTNELGPGASIGKAIASKLPSGKIVLLVPCAWGGTSLVSAVANSAPNPPQWATGRSLYAGAVAQINSAIAFAKNSNPASTFHSFHFIQGETDGDNGITQANYYNALSSLIAGMRGDVTGAASAPFVIGGMMPEAIASRGG